MIDLKRFAGVDVVVQFGNGERWFVWAAPTRLSKVTQPELVQMPNADGDSVPVPMPFVRGKVTEDGDLIVDTGNGGKLKVVITPSTIASVTLVHELAAAEERSNLIVPGN